MKPESGGAPSCETTNVTNQTVVMLGIKKDKIQMFPRRRGDAVAYYKHGNDTSPEKPEQIRWVVSGLSATQSIRITAKEPGSGIFPADEYRIENGCNSVLSGLPLRCPNGPVETWGYNVLLMEGDQQIHDLDPEVIIRSDP